MSDVEAFTDLRSRVVPVPTANIDTDRIVPARFLTITDRSGLDRALFADWRRGPGGAPNPDCPLDLDLHRGAEILLAGDNFGCGSSREHAAWALLAGGFRVILGTRFADIFRGNALRNGLLAIEIEPTLHRRLLTEVREDPSLEVGVSLERREVRIGNGDPIPFEIDSFSRECLLRGLDQLGFLVEQLDSIEAWEAQREPRIDTRADGSSAAG